MDSGAQDPGIERLGAWLGLLAGRDPGWPALVYLEDGENESARITRGGLHRQAMRVAEGLRRHRLVGERVVLALQSSPDCVVALLGCLYAGAVAVPAFAPRQPRQARLLSALLRDAGARVLLASDALCAGVQQRLAGEGAPAVTVLGLGALGAQVPLDHPGWINEALQPADLAYLQYTSGSTSQPKGVMVPHGNLLANCAHLADSVGVRDGRSFVSWLPLHHDMGLVAGLLMPLTLGAMAVLMPPAAFIQRPLRWLQAVSQYRACFSAAPDFAFDLCAGAVSAQQAQALDLSAWRVALNGAEPLRASTLDRFQARFAAAGLPADALRGGYGLAEATLAVTAGAGGQAAARVRVDADALAQGRVLFCEAGGTVLVSSGHVRPEGCALRIVRPDDGAPCAPLEVGELWLQGPSVASGYWGRAKDSAATFGAVLADSPGRTWLRTGDLGFVHDGELVVTGRLKDLLIVRGANHHPQDVEQTARQAHADLDCEGRSAAFMLDAEGDAAPRIALVLEVDRQARHRLDADAIGRCVADAVAAAHGIELDLVVLVPPAGVPRTTSGKVQRAACRGALLAGELGELARWQRPAAAAAGVAPAVAADVPLADWLHGRVAALLRRPVAEVPRQRPFAELGLDSAQLVALSGELSNHLGRRLPASLLYDHPSIEAMAAHLDSQMSGHAAEAREAARAAPIAIVGIACRLPGAEDTEAFWRLLAEGRDAVREWSAERSRLTGWTPAPDAPQRHAGFIDDVDAFDAALFGISPREARLMDPQQRLLLETAWRALEHARIAPDGLRGTDTGVFIGISGNDYYRLMCAAGVAADAHAGTGGAPSIAANRLSYCFGLQGPSLAIDTACSSSLVAVHQACASLASGESRLALAGGVNLLLAQELGAAFGQAGMLAPDGRCKTFDAAADGYVRGEGCGVLVLQRLDEALRDGRRVLGVIAGSAVNQDGASNGLTAPSGLAQQRVVRQALQRAGLPAAAIDAVETHGSGTALGDPIEVHALRAVLDAEGAPPCRLAALKTQIGHLEAAAGVAGVIKLLLALRHGRLPGNLHFQALNPQIDLAGSRLQLLAAPVAWDPVPGRPRRAGVSAFGFGGTNAHLVIEEAPPQPALNAAEADWPARPFARQRHWFSAGPAAAPMHAAEPAGRRIDLASEAVQAFEIVVSAGHAGPLLEHVVAGSALMPAAGWIAMAADALRRAAPAGEGVGLGVGVLLSDLHFEQALGLGAPVAVQTVLTRDMSGHALDILRRSPDGQGWQRCVRASQAQALAAPLLPLQGFNGIGLGDEGMAVDADAFYALLRASGLDHGPSFRALHGLRHRGEVVTGRLRLNDAAVPLPVPWLDAALHAAAVLLRDDLQPARGVPVPVVIAQLRWDGRPPVDGQAVQARLRERQPLHAVADLQVLHADGTPCLQVQGLRVQWVAALGARPVVSDDAAVSAAPDLPPLDTLLALDPAEALAALRRGLAGLLREVLQLDADCLPEDDAERLARVRLSSLGVDSLAAMELRDRLQRWLGAELPARDLVSGAELGTVLSHLHQHLLLKRLSQPAHPMADGEELEVVIL